MTRPISTGIYVVMAVWLIVAATGRVLLQVTGTLPLDPLPFISAALGITALILLFVLPARTP